MGTTFEQGYSLDKEYSISKGYPFRQFFPLKEGIVGGFYKKIAKYKILKQMFTVIHIHGRFI